MIKAYFSGVSSEIKEKYGTLEKAFPGNVYTKFFHAYISDMQGDVDGALREYSEVIRLAPEVTEAYVYRGKIFGDKGMYDRGIADVSKAIEIEGKETPAFFYTTRGDIYGLAKKYEASIADFKQSILLLPSKAENYVGFINMAFAAGNTTELESILSDAVNGAQADNPGVNLAYADFLLRTKRFKEADEIYTKVINRNGYIAEGEDYNRASIAAYRLKNYYNAALLLEKAISLSPRNVDFIVNRASIAIDEGKWEDVYTWAQKAVAMDANHARANMMMAVGIKRTGRGDALSAEYEAKAKRLEAENQ